MGEKILILHLWPTVNERRAFTVHRKVIIPIMGLLPSGVNWELSELQDHNLQKFPPQLETTSERDKSPVNNSHSVDNGTKELIEKEQETASLPRPLSWH